MESIDNTKANLFDHIFYEIEMYLVTRMHLESGDAYICDVKNHSCNKQLAINLLLEGHQHYARNIIEFFSSKTEKPDDLRVGKILNNGCKIFKYTLNKSSKNSIDKIIMEIWEILNKGVSHLTDYRTSVGLSKRTHSFLNRLYNGDDQEGFKGLKEVISQFLSLLIMDNIVSCYITVGDNKSHDLKEEFSDKTIQERLSKLKNWI